jgi:Porin PorA
MRRVTGLVLAGLGIVLVAAAVILPTYVSGQIAKFPLDENTKAILAGTGVSYFSQVKLSEKAGVSVRATYTIKGDAAAGNSSTAVWNQTASSYDVTNNLPVSNQTRRFAFDRRTGELVDCCGANVNGDTRIRQTGLVGYVFPIGTQKKTYQVFDTTLNRAVPFTFAGTATTDGVPTYMFTENVAPTQVATVTVPGSFFGLAAKVVKLPEIYQIHLIYWVDPETGGLLNVNEDEKVTLQNPATGATVAVLFNGDLVATPATVTEVVSLDSSGRNELSLLDTIIPLAAGIVGGVALIAGVILLLRKPRQDHQNPGPASQRSSKRAASSR